MFVDFSGSRPSSVGNSGVARHWYAKRATLLVFQNAESGGDTQPTAAGIASLLEALRLQAKKLQVEHVGC